MAKSLIQAALIMMACLWIYAPAFHGAWVGDDNMLVTDNALVKDPHGLSKIWLHPTYLIDYQPIKFSVTWLQWQFWGDHTLGYHLTNVVLHLLSCFLVWKLLAKFNLRWAWLGGLLFAIHPVQVESVAWISELKNTLALPPLLLAMICWIDFQEHQRKRDYALALGFFIVAMLCKGTAVMFPVVLLFYAWWRRGKIAATDLKLSIPFFTVSLVMGLITVSFLRDHAIGNQGVQIGGPLTRLALAGLTSAFYFSKCFLPVDLMPVYPRWGIDPPSPLQFLPLFVLIAMLYWLWTKRNGWGRHALLGVGFFFINLLPFIGLTAGSYMVFTWVTEHTLYLPIIGLIGVTITGLERLDFLLPKPARVLETAAIVIALALLAVESHAYAAIYVDKETLCLYALKKNPEAAPAHLALALGYLNLGRVAEARAHAEEVVRLNPNLEMGHQALGQVLFKQGKLAQAEEQDRLALKLDPNHADAHSNLAGLLAQSGRYDEAMSEFNQALALQHDHPDAFAGRAELKRCLGDWKGAVVDADRAIALDPQKTQPYLTRSVINEARGEFFAAISDLREFRELAPKDPNADYAALWIWAARQSQNQKTDADHELLDIFTNHWNTSHDDLVSLHARFLLGQIDEPTYRAGTGAEDKVPAGQVCEMSYYEGIKLLSEKNPTKAILDFKACIATQKVDFFEYTLAQGELNRINAR